MAGKSSTGNAKEKQIQGNARQEKAGQSTGKGRLEGVTERVKQEEEAKRVQELVRKASRKQLVRSGCICIK